MIRHLYPMGWYWWCSRRSGADLTRIHFHWLTSRRLLLHELKLNLNVAQNYSFFARPLRRVQPTVIWNEEAIRISSCFMYYLSHKWKLNVKLLAFPLPLTRIRCPFFFTNWLVPFPPPFRTSITPCFPPLNWWLSLNREANSHLRDGRGQVRDVFRIRRYNVNKLLHASLGGPRFAVGSRK